jgi:hypothetical protein
LPKNAPLTRWEPRLMTAMLLGSAMLKKVKNR